MVAPLIGHEGTDGIPLDLAWPDSRVAVEVDPLPEQDRQDLAADGWVVVPAHLESIIDALRRTRVREEMSS